MRAVSKTGRVLIQIGAIVAFLNAQLVFASCAMAMEPANTDAHNSPPCHPVAASNAAEAVELEEEDCCAVCVPAAILQSADAVSAAELNIFAPQSIHAVPSSGFDPPFRPPASSLS